MPHAASSTSAATRSIAGSLHGQGVAQVMRAQQAGLVAPSLFDAGLSTDKPLSQRQVRRESSSSLASPRKQAQYLRATGNARGASLQALDILRHGRPAPAAVGRRNVVNRFLGTARAMRAVALDVDDVYRLALLCPFRHAPDTPRELFELLTGASPEQMEDMAEDLAAVDVFKRPPDKLMKALDSVRYNQRELVAFLQESLGLNHTVAHKGYPGSAEEWSERLQDAGGDEDVAVILGEIEGLEVNPDLIKLVRRACRNPRELNAVLRHALGLPHQDEDGLINLRQALQDDLHEQELSDGAIIQASLDAGEIAAKAGQAEDANAFLDSCADLLFGASGFGDAARKMIARFGLDRLPATVGLMKEALQSMQGMLESMKKELGGELREARPVRDKVHLGAILRALSHIHVLATLAETVDGLVKSVEAMAHAAGIASPTLDASVMLAGLIDIVNGSRIHSGLFERLLKDMGVEGDTARIIVLQGMKQLLRSLPDKAFPDAKTLPASIGAAQELLDAAIDREEELAENGQMDPMP
jgi:type III secretion system TyeA family effector delivery regulator